MAYETIQEAHGELVHAVSKATKSGFTPIPISLVSVDERPTAQMVIFDGNKFTPEQVAERLRIAAEFLDNSGPSKSGEQS